MKQDEKKKQQHHTAWLTTDPTIVKSDGCELEVYRDKISGHAEDGEPELEMDEEVDGTRVVLTTRHQDVGDTEELLAEAEQALKAGGWNTAEEWEPTATGWAAVVTRHDKSQG